MQTIYIDIANKSVLPTIYAKQGEVGRKFEVVLTDSGVPYNVESGVLFSVWYEGASGEGNYTDIGENSAFTISGNRVVVELITQMLVNPGFGTVCLVMNKGANQIGVWNIPYICEQVPGFNSEEAEGYYTAFSEAVEKIASPDPTLSVVGAPAEAKATGDALAERAFAERTVNGHPLTEDINLNAEDIGAAPALESTEYSGCYYRTVDGVTEWINPPMVAGLEYRTTERYNGKEVYAKAIDLGTLPASGDKSVSYSSKSASIVSITAIAISKSGTQYPFPCVSSSGAINGIVSASHYNLFVTAFLDMSSFTGFAIVRYTKD